MSSKFQQSCFPDKVTQLFDTVHVQDLAETVLVFCHTLLMESGFHPENVPSNEIYTSMPKDWNVHGIFRIQYSHYGCPDYKCDVDFVPMKRFLIIHGHVQNRPPIQFVHLKIDLKIYGNESKELLEIYFKDYFCIPFLNVLYEEAGLGRPWGFSGLPDDLKILILKFLPVESFLSMCAVNKHLHSLGDSAYIWRYLVMRDFGKQLDKTSAEWKELYKAKYARKKSKRRFNRPMKKNFPSFTMFDLHTFRYPKYYSLMDCDPLLHCHQEL